MIVFNNKKTKSWAINLVGKEFCDKYLSHSTLAAKSLIRLGSGTGALGLVDAVTGMQNHANMTDNCKQLRQDIHYYLFQVNDKGMAKKAQDTLEKTIRDYQPGGLISHALRNEKYIATLDTVSTSLNRFFGKKD